MAHPKRKKSKASRGETVTKAEDFDVLLGRGRGNQKNPGNIHFNRLVARHRENYFQAKLREKKAITSAIVSDIYGKRGRFLKKEGDGWVVVTWEDARVKTAHALQYRHRRSSLSPKSPSSFETKLACVECDDNLNLQVLEGIEELFEETNPHEGPHVVSEGLLNMTDELIAFERDFLKDLLDTDIHSISDELSVSEEVNDFPLVESNASGDPWKSMSLHRDELAIGDGDPNNSWDRAGSQFVFKKLV